MTAKGRLLTAAFLIALGGCAGAPQKPIPVDPAFWQDRGAVIGVAADKMPQADAYMVGAQGLLDVAINRANAATLIEQLKRLDVDRAAAIPDNLASALTRRGFKVEKLPTVDVAALPEFKADSNPELYAARDFRGLASKGIERLLVVSVESIGTTRSYYGPIPLGAPRAQFAVRGQLVDLKTNKLIWYDRQETAASIAEPWDQEPDFPNVSEAVLKTMAEGAVLLERSLFASPAGAAATAGAYPGQQRTVVAPGVVVVRELPRPSEAPVVRNEERLARSAAQAARPPASAGPRVGDQWKYSLRDQKYSQRERYFTARVTAVDGSSIDETIQLDGGSRIAAPTDSRSLRFAARTADDLMFVELSPYLANRTSASTRSFGAPADYPIGVSGEKFQIHLESVGQEEIRVPLGSFKTVRIVVSGQRSGNDLGAVAGIRFNPYFVARFRYTAWYAPDVARYVKARHMQWNPGGELTGDEVVQLLEYSKN